jgi:DNA-binding CsgD family transcriptional regulator
LANHYGVEVAVCPPRRAQRTGVVEAAIKYITNSGWRSARITTMAEAQGPLDRWTVAVADRRPRSGGTASSAPASRCDRCRRPPTRRPCASSARRRGPPWSPSSATAYEERAQGRANKEIAAALHMSMHTVEAHLTRTYRKLGIRSRAALATRLTASDDETTTP